VVGKSARIVTGNNSRRRKWGGLNRIRRKGCKWKFTAEDAANLLHSASMGQNKRGAWDAGYRI